MTEKFDVIVVGAGAAGMMSSIEAGKRGRKVLLVDHAKKIGEKIRDGFKIAIVGPPNAGKSSLLNYLANRDAAIVSETAGTTRDVVEVHLNIDGYPVIMSDTAGIRESRNEIERKGIKLSINRAEDADLKLVVIDAKNVEFTDLLLNLLKNDSILVVNKSDLLNKDININ